MPVGKEPAHPLRHEQSHRPFATYVPRQTKIDPIPKQGAGGGGEELVHVDELLEGSAHLALAEPTWRLVEEVLERHRDPYGTDTLPHLRDRTRADVARMGDHSKGWPSPHQERQVVGAFMEREQPFAGQQK